MKSLDSLSGTQRALRYCDYVERGLIITNKWVKLAVKRFRQNMSDSESDDYPYFYDERAADRFIAFTETLKQTNDQWRGTPLHLEDWQCFCFCNIYGWKKKSDNCRRFRKALIFVARKNGKTTMLSASLLYDLLITNGAQAMSAATKREQAKLIFNVCKEMVRQNDVLSSRLKIYESTNRIVNQARAGYIEPLAAESDKLDGLNPSCAVIDEVAAQKNMRLISVIQSGQGSRPEPLLIEITSGSDDVNSAGAMEFERASKILEGAIEDDSFFCILYCLDKDDSWMDGKNDQKANPNLGVSVKKEFIESFRKEAIQSPSMEGEFRIKLMGQWISPISAWIPYQRWQVCRQNARDWGEPDLSNCIAVGGVDLSQRIDFTSFSVYLYDTVKQVYYARHHFYIPEEQVEVKCKGDSPMVWKWIEQGLITATPGATVKASYMFEDMKKAIEEYEVTEFLYDPWNAGMLEEEMGQYCDLIKVPQSIKEISPMAKDWEAAVIEGRIADDNPCMAWMVSNCDILRDAHGNIRPEKHGGKDSPLHIDGVMTSLMSLGRIQQRILAGDADKRSPEQIEADMEARLAGID